MAMDRSIASDSFNQCTPEDNWQVLIEGANKGAIRQA